MALISATLEADFATYTAAQREAVVAKLRRYVERGLWAQEVLRKLGDPPEAPAPQPPAPAEDPGAQAGG